MAMIVMIGGLGYSVYALTSIYLSYPVSVSVNVLQARKLVFPAVTICNMSPVKKSALQTMDLEKRKRRKKRSTGLDFYCAKIKLKLLIIKEKYRVGQTVTLPKQLQIN